MGDKKRKIEKIKILAFIIYTSNLLKNYNGNIGCNNLTEREYQKEDNLDIHIRNLIEVHCLNQSFS